MHRGSVVPGTSFYEKTKVGFRVSGQPGPPGLSTVLNQAVHCYQHPQRLGIGICVECRQVVCAECSTQFEGINRCARCLARMAPKQTEQRAFKEWGPLSLLGALFCGGLLYGGVLILAFWVRP